MILVVGSVHADIVASFDPATEENVDKIGAIRISVGGTAFNVAANLVYDGHKAMLYTHLRRDSMISSIVERAIRTLDVDPRYIQLDAELPESAFVAQMSSLREGRGAELYSAVSCVGMEFATLNRKLLHDGMTRCRVVVVDCNLRVEQLVQLTQMAKELSVPVLVGAVSESKVERLSQVSSRIASPFDVAAMNLAEARRLGLSGELNNESLQAVRRASGASTVIVTDSEEGYHICDASGGSRHVRFNAIPGIKSTLGAGDALLAAVASRRSRGAPIDWNRCEEDIDKFVNRVLGVSEASPQASGLSQLRLRGRAWRHAEVHTLLLFIGAVATSVPATFGGVDKPLLFGALLFITALLAGAAGGLAQWIRRQGPRAADSFALRSTVLGLMAGFVSAVSFAVAQTLTHGPTALSVQVPDSFYVLTPFALIISFVAGLTADAVFGRLEEKDALEMSLPSGSSRG